MKNLERFSKPIVRIAMGILFILFGIMQIRHPVEWSGFVPQFMINLGLSAVTVIKANALLEMSLGALMLIGLYTHLSSLILSIHLFFIAATLGLNDLAVRDFGLAFATLSVFFSGPDDFCLDMKFKKKAEVQQSPEKIFLSNKPPNE